MPGLVGALGFVPNRQDLFLRRALKESFHGVESVPGVRQGAAWIVHAAATPAGHGSCYIPGLDILVAYWGEFYDQEALRQPDGRAVAELLARRLAASLSGTLTGLDGSFALFAQLPDGRQILVSDRVASRPIYYAAVPDGLLFAPDLSLIPALSPRTFPLDRNSLVSFVVNGHPISDTTYLRGVRLLKPTHVLEFQGGAVTAEEYSSYRPSDPQARDLGEEAYAEGLAAVLRAAVQKRLRNIEDAVVPISGGYDSRGLLATIREVYSGGLTTVSWGVDEADPEADAAVGRKLAERFSTTHHFLRRRPDFLADDLERMTAYMDAANDDCLFHHHEPALVRQLRTDLGRLVLYRGDECFGYGGPASTAFEALGRINIRDIAQYPDLAALLHPEAASSVIEEQREQLHEVIGEAAWAGDWTIAKDWLYLRQRLFRSLNVSNYAKLCMLEARNPWLDRDVLDFFSGLPTHYRHDKSLYRRTLSAMFPNLMAQVPLARKWSLEDWGTIHARDARYRQLVLTTLGHGESPLFQIFDRAAVLRQVEAFFAGRAAASLRTRAVERAKGALRTHAAPLYRLIKKRLGPSLIILEMPPESIVGRLTVLKLWLDQLS